MLLVVARDFMRAMAQPYDRGAIGKSLLSAEAVEALEERHQADKAAARAAEDKQRAAAAAGAGAGAGAAAAAARTWKRARGRGQEGGRQRGR
jgi:hypothetical protein